MRATRGLLAAVFLEVGRHHRLGVDADELRVGADEALVENAAGKVPEVVALERVEITEVDLRRLGDLPERDLTQLPLASEGFSEGRHQRSPGRTIIPRAPGFRRSAGDCRKRREALSTKVRRVRRRRRRRSARRRSAATRTKRGAVTSRRRSVDIPARERRDQSERGRSGVRAWRTRASAPRADDSRTTDRRATAGTRRGGRTESGCGRGRPRSPSRFPPRRAAPGRPRRRSSISIDPRLPRRASATRSPTESSGRRVLSSFSASRRRTGATRRLTASSARSRQ